MSIKVTKNTETQDYQKDSAGWLLLGLQKSTYNALLPIFNAYSDNRAITEVNLIKLGVNKEVLSSSSLATDLFIWSDGQYLTDDTKAVSLPPGIFKIQFANGFDIYETEPFKQNNLNVQYRNGVVTNAIFGQTAVFDFEAKANFDGTVVFTVDWGSEIGTSKINTVLVNDTWKSLQTSILIPDGVALSQTINVIDSLRGNYSINYTVVKFAELHTFSNAAADPNGTEADAITGPSETGLNGFGANVFESQSSVVNTGSYAFRAESNDTPTNTAKFYFELNNAPFSLVNGTEYEIKFNARHVGTGGNWRILLNNAASVGSPTQTVVLLNNTDITWTEYTATFTHDIVNTAFFVAGESGASNDGGVYFDNFSLKEV